MVCPSMYLVILFYETAFLLFTIFTPVSADSLSLGQTALGTLAVMYCFPVQAHILSDMLFVLHIKKNFHTDNILFSEFRF